MEGRENMKEFRYDSDFPVAQTPKGKIRGFFYDGVYQFRGIRYARAERFRMPEPVEPWEGVMEATNYGLNCPVLNEPAPSSEIMTPHRFWPASEHCQFLNIWTPTMDPEAKKPVMFWMHGGGYFAGSAIEQECYDGFNLARKDDVVFVSINHRLNAFGHLDLSAFGPEYANSANAGIADIVEALRWVRDNIRAFGGDPDNVTVFGQSGGGEKATVLAQIPEAEGLFARMIVMSGVIPTGNFDTDCDAEELALKIMEYLQIRDGSVEKLAKVPVPQFMWAVNKATAFFAKKGIRVNWQPKANDYYLGNPLTGDFTPWSLTVPTMVGTVFSEFNPAEDLGEREKLTPIQREQRVKDFYGEKGGEDILAAFRKAYPGMNEVYACEIDTMFLPDTVRYVRKKAAEASAPVYNYLFAKTFDIRGGRAAWHCSDIPYFLHNGELVPVCHQRRGEYLDSVMSGAFVNFARTGDPNTEGLPEWDACSGERMVTMVFDDQSRTAENLQDVLLPLVLKYRPPFRFEASVPQEDQEESASAWVF